MKQFWLTIWTRPRSTIRAIVQVNPRYGVLFLAAINTAENLFYCFYYLSLGLKVSPLLLLLIILFLAPIAGGIWLYYSAWLLSVTGRLNKGTASTLYLRTAFAWSKVPSLISLLMWLILFYINPNAVFVHSTLPLFVNPIMFLLGIWSLILLVQEIRELQSFSLRHSVVNVLLSNSFSFLILIAAMFAVVRFSAIS